VAFTYTLQYTALARNVSVAALQAAMGAVARDPDLEAIFGLTLLSDATVPGPPPNSVVRTIKYTQPTDGSLVPDLTNVYTGVLYKALSTPISAAAPTVV